MTRMRCGLALAAGLCLAATWRSPAAAQEVSGPVPPPPGAMTSAAAGPGVVPPRPPGGPVEYAAPGPAPTLIMPTPPPSYTRTGQERVGGWRWHWFESRRKHQEKYLGYPEEFNEWPLGRSVYAHAGTQVNNGAAARMFFYDYDFVDGTAELNLRGCDKLAVIGAQLPTNFFPVVIERTPKAPGLDQTRRLAILARLAGGPFPVPAERVLIGPPMATGRMGIEAIVVEQNRLGTVATGGALLGGAGAGTSVGASALDSSGLSGSAVAAGVR